jgi:hypothetical protein
MEKDPEIAAIESVVDALRDLPADARQRVLRYVAGKFSIGVQGLDQPRLENVVGGYRTAPTPTATLASSYTEGVSPVALKWMQRSGFSPQDLAPIFSLGGGEIDLITNDVPGKSKRQRMRNVLLLKGICTYLGKGVPRVAYDELRQACEHYDAYDGANFAANLKSFSAEVSGNKESGFTLSARGLSAATSLIRTMIKSES